MPPLLSDVVTEMKNLHSDAGFIEHGFFYLLFLLFLIFF